MKAKKYEVTPVLNILKKNKDILLIPESNRVLVNIDHQGTVGNSTWGKIDFLEKILWKVNKMTEKEFSLEKRELLEKQKKYKT